MRAATSAPFEGRNDVRRCAARDPRSPATWWPRFFHAGSCCVRERDDRGDGHIAALMIEGVGGLEVSRPLPALDMGIAMPERLDRIHHLPAARSSHAVIDGMCAIAA